MTNYRAPSNIRFPPDLHADIKKLAEKRDVTFTQIVIEACYQYIDGYIPGLCPSCHTQNTPDAQYCQKCGYSLLPGVSEQVAQYRVEREEIGKDIDRVLETLEPYKPLIELSKEFSNEDLTHLIQLSNALIKHKDLMKDMIAEVKKKEKSKETE